MCQQPFPPLRVFLCRVRERRFISPHPTALHPSRNTPQLLNAETEEVHGFVATAPNPKTVLYVPPNDGDGAANSALGAHMHPSLGRLSLALGLTAACLAAL